jgi:hypothetical protein
VHVEERELMRVFGLGPAEPLIIRVVLMLTPPTPVASADSEGV